MVHAHSKHFASVHHFLDTGLERNQRLGSFRLRHHHCWTRGQLKTNNIGMWSRVRNGWFERLSVPMHLLPCFCGKEALLYLSSYLCAMIIKYFIIIISSSVINCRVVEIEPTASSSIVSVVIRTEQHNNICAKISYLPAVDLSIPCISVCLSESLLSATILSVSTITSDGTFQELITHKILAPHPKYSPSRMWFFNTGKAVLS